jgi:hypothetical protein
VADSFGYLPPGMITPDYGGAVELPVSNAVRRAGATPRKQTG